MLSKIWNSQEFRFLFTGGLNTLVGYGIYAILLYFNVNYLIANTISTIIGIAHSYLWNRFFTFKSKEKAGKELAKFISVYIVSYLFGTMTLYGFKNILNISPYIAGLLNLIITTLISWIGHKNFSFNQESFDFKETWKKNKKYILPVILFLIYFGLLLMYKNHFDFTDEGDVMLGATMLSKGKLIYIDFASQHLPLMYFIFAPFALFGINSVLGFRICMYLLLACIWVLMYIRYRKYFGSMLLILYPFSYILCMSIPDFLSATVVSEQIASQCLVIILLELFLFYKTKKLDWKSQVLIPTCMIIAIGVSFVSIIPCFISVITFYYIDIKAYRKEKKFSLGKYLNHFWKKYKTIFIVAISIIAIMVGYLILTGSLEECYKQAFYLNTEVYSKYNGYSSNPFKTILLIVPKFLMSLPNYLKISTMNIIWCGLWISVILLFLKLAKKDFIFACLITLVILLGGNRGFDGFHALPYFACASFAGIYAIKDIKIKYQHIIIGLFIVVFIKQCSPYFSNIYQPKLINEPYYEILNKLVPEEEIFHVDINTPEYINSQKIPASKFNGMVPWFAEVYEEDLLNEIKQKNPNIIYYSPYGEVWGYLYKDFVSKINDYILNNYTYSIDYNLWIKKDYIETAEELLETEWADYSNLYNQYSMVELMNNEVEQIIYPEENVNQIGLKFYTYNRTNYSLIEIEIKDEKEVIYSQRIPASQLKDNVIYLIDIKNQQLKKNQEYKIKITSLYTNINDYVAIYKVSDEFNLDQNQLFINGVSYEEDLAMVMYYEEKNN